jgi:hypothetical protein
MSRRSPSVSSRAAAAFSHMGRSLVVPGIGTIRDRGERRARSAPGSIDHCKAILGLDLQAFRDSCGTAGVLGTPIASGEMCNVIRHMRMEFSRRE